ncbi:MAG: hypothetical protein AB1589_30900 [Cyanobacteriota bacterium]
MKPTIADLSNNTTISADELAQVVKDNFQDRTSVEITKDTRVDELPEHLQGQIGLTAWSFTKD